MLCSKHPNCGVIIGADENGMDISPILKCRLRLRQVVTKNTKGNKIIDFILMNMFSLYQTPIIAPPLATDDPKTSEPSDHSMPVHTI